MSLRRKFVILLVVLGCTAAINLSASVWAIVHYETSIARPLDGIQRVMIGLQRSKRAAGTAHNLLVGSLPQGDAAPIGPSAATGARSLSSVGELGSQARSALDLLERTVPEYQLFAGISTTQNIRLRVDRAFDRADEWLALPEPQRAEREQLIRDAAQDLFHSHELIELMEQRMLESAALTVSFSDSARRSALLILTASALAVITSGFLAVRLVSRWVLAPVAALREAAGRVAEGDYSRRVEVRGEDEIATLGREFNHMTEMVVAMQEERIERERLAAVGEMVRRIVHNLRNPLSGIRSLAELTLADLPAGSDARRNQGRIMTTIDRFESWLTRLLNVTRPLSLAVGETAVEPWLSEIIEAHRPMAQAKGVTLILESDRAPTVAWIDAAQVEQALSAIVTNGVAASPGGGEVTLLAERDPKAERWRIVVQDSGPGIPPEDRDQIFRPYFTTKPDGNGIGLAIAKQVVEQHGGRISLESPKTPVRSGKTGSGARFVVTLPLIVKPEVARIGHGGSANGQDSHHRGRREPPVLDRAGPEEGSPRDP